LAAPSQPLRMLKSESSQLYDSSQQRARHSDSVRLVSVCTALSFVRRRERASVRILRLREEPRNDPRDLIGEFLMRRELAPRSAHANCGKWADESPLARADWAVCRCEGVGALKFKRVALAPRK
jgi:hypothetical protein